MTKLLILIFLSISSSAMAQQLASSQTQKGFFSLGVFAGLDQSRFLNTDGSLAGYHATRYGLDLDIQLWNSGAGDVRLFGELNFATGSGTAADGDKINSDGTFYGLKVYAGTHFFVAAGMGTQHSSMTTETGGDKISLKYPITGMGLGGEFAISESFSMGLQGWYRSGPIKARENVDLTENSFMEGAQLRLNLIWSPPAMTLNFTK